MDSQDRKYVKRNIPPQHNHGSPREGQSGMGAIGLGYGNLLETEISQRKWGPCGGFLRQNFLRSTAHRDINSAEIFMGCFDCVARFSPPQVFLGLYATCGFAFDPRPSSL